MLKVTTLGYTRSGPIVTIGSDAQEPRDDYMPKIERSDVLQFGGLSGNKSLLSVSTERHGIKPGCKHDANSFDRSQRFRRLWGPGSIAGKP